MSNIVSDTDSATRSTLVEGSGLVKLNSIPFSMTSYLQSLSEEEKRLLQLECEVMGKSWQVAYFLKFACFFFD